MAVREGVGKITPRVCSGISEPGVLQGTDPVEPGGFWRCPTGMQRVPRGTVSSYAARRALHTGRLILLWSCHDCHSGV